MTRGEIVFYAVAYLGFAWIIWKGSGGLFLPKNIIGFLLSILFCWLVALPLGALVLAGKFNELKESLEEERHNQDKY